MGVEPPPEKLVAFDNNMKLADQLIGDNKYLTGDHLTIADLSILANTVFIIFSSVDLSGYPNFRRWANYLQTSLPYFADIFMSATPDQIQAYSLKAKEYLNRKFNEL